MTKQDDVERAFGEIEYILGCMFNGIYTSLNHRNGQFDKNLMENYLEALKECIRIDKPSHCSIVKSALTTSGRIDGWRTMDDPELEKIKAEGKPILVYGTSPKTGDSWHEVAAYSDFYGMFMSGTKSIGHAFLTHWKPLDKPSEA